MTKTPLLYVWVPDTYPCTPQDIEDIAAASGCIVTNPRLAEEGDPNMRHEPGRTVWVADILIDEDRW